jgi:PAS domain S-box-containing protein
MRNLKLLLQQIPANLPYRVYVKDRQRRFVYANAVTLRALNVKDFSEIKKKRDEDYFDGSHLQEAIRVEEALLDPDGPEVNPPRLEIETWKDGRLSRVVTEKRAWIGRGGVRKGIIGFSHQVDRPGEAKIFAHALDNLGPSGEEYLGTYLTRLEPAIDPREVQHRGLFCDNERTWMDEIFKLRFPSKHFLQRMHLIVEEDRCAVLRFLKDAKTRGEGFHDSVTFRFVFPKNAGKQREVRATGVVFRDPHTKHLYFCVEHREVSNGLGRQALSYEILERFPGFIFVKDTRRRFVYMNKPLLEQFGMTDLTDLPKRASDGRRPSDMDFKLPARDRKVYERGDRAILEKKLPMYVSEDEVIMVADLDKTSRKKKRNRRRIRVSTIKMPVQARWFDPDEPDERVYVLGIAWKTNEILGQLHNKQKLWDTLLANVTDIIYSKRPDGRYEEVSGSFLDLLGWPRSEIVNRTAEQVWAEYPSIVAAIKEDDARIVKERRPLRTIVRTLERGGKKIVLRSQKFPILDENGQVRLILGISRY